jgi:hypothetical protein
VEVSVVGNYVDKPDPFKYTSHRYERNPIWGLHKRGKNVRIADYQGIAI